MKEIYRPVVGYENKYMVSNLGNVKSLDYQNTKKERVLTPIKHHGGYLLVHLGQSKIKMIHTLVAEAFIPNPEGKRFVNHIDGNKHNNSVKNLEWVTAKENQAHAVRMGLRNPHANGAKRGPENRGSKPVLQYEKSGALVRRWGCISDAARHIGCSPCMIVNNACGRTKSAKGFIWKYPE